MTRRRIAVALVVSLAAATLSAAQAAPRRVVAEWRAQRCCRQHCPAQRPVRMPSRCCDLRQAGTDATVPSAPVPVTPPLAAVMSLTAAPASPSDGGVSGEVRPLGRAGPIYLRTTRLRL